MNERNVLKDFIFQFEWNILFENYKLSNLYQWNYLLIKKNNSITIHNGLLTAPIFSEKEVNVIDYGNKLVIIKKKTKKSIKIYIYKSIFWNELINLSLNKPNKILEKDFRDKLAENLDLVKEGLKLIQKEFEIDYGLIDILAEKDNKYHIIELKKDKTNFNTISQVLRYKEYIEENLKKECICYVAGNWITEESKKFAENNWVVVLNFETLNLI